MYKGVGWYVNGRSNFNFHGTTDLTCTEGGFINGERAFYSGNKSVCHYIGNSLIATKVLVLMQVCSLVFVV
jgi:hypothetical protein